MCLRCARAHQTEALSSKIKSVGSCTTEHKDVFLYFVAAVVVALFPHSYDSDAEIRNSII